MTDDPEKTALDRNVISLNEAGNARCYRREPDKTRRLNSTAKADGGLA